MFTGRRQININRTAGWPVVLLILTVSLVFSTACATRVPATVTFQQRTPFLKSKSIFVVAQHQRDLIVQTLSDAGLQPTNDPNKAEYDLTVRQGSSRGGSDCGTVRNVSYIVTAADQRLIIIKGRGGTGSCSNGIYQDMSNELAALATE